MRDNKGRPTMPAASLANEGTTGHHVGPTGRAVGLEDPRTGLHSLRLAVAPCTESTYTLHAHDVDVSRFTLSDVVLLLREADSPVALIVQPDPATLQCVRGSSLRIVPENSSLPRSHHGSLTSNSSLV